MKYIEDQLCMQLYIKSRYIIRCHEKYLRPLGLTYPKALVLLVLGEKDECHIAIIAKQLHLDSGTLTPLLKSLESDGYIIKKRDIKDERRIFVSLTLLGATTIKEIKKIFENTAHTLTCSKSDKHTLLTILKTKLLKVNHNEEII